MGEEQGQTKRAGVCDVDAEVSHSENRLMDLQVIRHE